MATSGSQKYRPVAQSCLIKSEADANCKTVCDASSEHGNVPQSKTVALSTLKLFERDAPEGLPVDTLAYGPWFRRMARFAFMPESQLGGLDIGALNLEAAWGLPGAGNLNIDACVQQLNDWARQVQTYTEANWRLFQKSPEEYGNSPAQFRMLALVTYLQKHLDIHYNLSFSEGDYDATDSRNLFLHGILQGHGGTCATMPVLYVAIGRRLGYPLKLVRAKEHSFARWEGSGERFNIECTSPGFRVLDDLYFHFRPKPLSQEEIHSGYFLRSLCPREEVGQFLCERTRCLIDHLRPDEALRACFLAAKIAGDDQGVVGTWSVATVMARAMERARQKAAADNYETLDLPWIYVPDGKNPWERWAAPIVRDDLKRIAKLRDKRRAKTKQRSANAARQPFGTILVGANL